MRVCVFTGSAAGPASHRRSAEQLGTDLACAGVGVVYGGGHVGLMGVVADAVLAAGGEIIGVMPRHLVEGEIAHPGLSRLEVVADMHERKARMAELSDAFVALPGGAGTLEELFEVWTWGQLGLHHKPTSLLDVDGFFTPLLTQLDAMTSAGYLAPAYRDSLGLVTDARQLLDWVNRYAHPPAKWAAASSTSVPGEPGTDQIESVAWLHVDDGRILAVRTRGRDRFYLPGGKPEPGELAAEAVVREVREELGVTLTAVTEAFTITAPAHGLGRPATVTMRCFFAAGRGQPTTAGEIEELAWLTIPEDARAAPALAEAMRTLARDVTKACTSAHERNEARSTHRSTVPPQVGHPSVRGVSQWRS